MTRKVSVKRLIRLFAGMALAAVSCTQPIVSSDTDPEAPSVPGVPSAVITVESGAVSQGALYQTTLNNPVSFSASASTAVSGNLTYEWDFGDGSSTVTGETASYPYTIKNTYTVTLTVTDDAEGTSDTDTVVILINDPPSVNIDSGDQNVDEGIEINFTSTCTDTDGMIQTYHWDLGNGFISTGDPNIDYIYPNGGTFTVTLTVTDDEGTSNSDSITATINPVNNDPPEAAFVIDDADGIVNRDVTINFDASSSSDPDGDPLTYYWDFGDGSTAPGITTSHPYTDSGNYTVTLNVTDDDDVSDPTPATTVIHVNYEPQASFTLSEPATGTGYLINEIITFTSTSADTDGVISNYIWNFGDGGSSYSSTDTHSYNSLGDKTISLTVVDNDNAMHTTEETIVINDPPTATITGIPTGNLVNQNMEFTLTSSVTDANDTTFSYVWDMGDGTVIDPGTESVSHTYTTADPRQVTLTVTDDSGHSNTDTIDLTVNVAPIAIISGTPLGNRVNLNTVLTLNGNTSTDSDGTITSWLWTMSDGTTYSTENISHIYTTNSDGNITLQVTDNNGGTHTATYEIFVNEAPTAAFSQSGMTAHPGDAIIFDASLSSDPDAGDTLTYNWDFDFPNNTAIGTGLSPSHIYTEIGTYTVVLTVSDSSLSNTSTVDIEVVANALPTAIITDTPTNDTVDIGTEISLNGITSTDSDGTITSYEWVSSDGGSGSDSEFAHTYNSSDDVEVTLLVTDDDGGTNNVAYTVFVNEAPTAAFTPNATQNVLTNDIVNFNASTSTDPDSDTLTYSWDFGDGTTVDDLTLATTSHTYTVAGNYTVTLTVYDGRLENIVPSTVLINVTAP